MIFFITLHRTAVDSSVIIFFTRHNWQPSTLNHNYDIIFIIITYNLYYFYYTNIPPNFAE